MGCLLVMLGAFFPRLGVFFVWLARPALFEAAIPSALVAVLGVIFFPLTTLMWVIVFPGGIDGFDGVWLALAVVLDLGSAFGGAYGNRGRMRTA